MVQFLFAKFTSFYISIATYILENVEYQTITIIALHLHPTVLFS